MANKVKKTTQTSTTNDDNNCTVLALKSVTGWTEKKCQTILAKAGRKKDKGFAITQYLKHSKKIEDVQFTKIAEPNWYRNNNTYALKDFATHRNKGVYYVVTNTHALAIVDGVIVDNLTGRQAGDRRHVQHAWKVTGNIKPNIGKVSKEDTLPKKRYPKLDYGELVIYNGPDNVYENILLCKKGDLVRVNTQQSNGLVVLTFHHPSENYVIKSKIGREFFEVTEKRKADIFKDFNIIKIKKNKK